MFAGASVGRPSAESLQLGAAAAAALVLGLAVATDLGVAVLLIAAALLPALYLRLASSVGAALAFLLPAFLAGLLLPYSASLAVQATLVAVIVGATVVALGRREPTAWGALAILAVVGFWVLLTLNPNVPSAAVGIQGVRKTTFFLLGLALGLVWPGRSSNRAEHAIARLLLAAAVATIFVHLALPDVEASFERGASAFTEEFGGQARVSGFFSGPFHVSLLGAFLVIWAWHLYLSKSLSRWFIAGALASGLMLVVLAAVRTGYLTIGFGVAITLLMRPSSRGSRLRVVALTGAVAVAVALLLSTSLVHDRALASLGHLGGDQRVASRLQTITQSEQLIRESPLVGWGPGSAGSALGTEFLLGRHVTSHDMALGFLVEGGILGLALVALALFVALRRTRGLLSLSHPAAAAAFALIGFGIAGDVSEALPVSFFLMALLGLRARTLRLEPSGER